MSSTVERSAAVRILAHVLVGVGLLADAAQIVLDPGATFAALLPWGLAAVVLPVVVLIVGWLLALRRPRLSLGWLFIVIGVLVSTESAIGVLGAASIQAAPTVALWLLWYGGVNQWAWIPPVGLLFTQVPLRFPDGRLPSPRWKWFSRYTFAALAVTCAVFATVEPTLAPGVANPTFGHWGAATGLISVVPAALTAVAFAGSIASLVLRYRRGDAVMRAQLRWIFWAAAVVAALLIISWFGDPSTPGVAGAADLIVSSAAALSYSLVPLAVLLAVMRHGLYSIDRLISRTAAYTIVTATVVGTYALIVVLASLLLPTLPSVGVAVATLVAAGVFLPVLRTVRSVIDRIFDRSRYDAEAVVERFGESVRNGADPHTAGADLIDAVERTLQPNAVGLWMTDRPAQGATDELRTIALSRSD